MIIIVMQKQNFQLFNDVWISLYACMHVYVC